MANKNIKRCLKIISIQGNSNENHNEIFLCTHHVAEIRNHDSTEHWQRCRETESRMLLWGSRTVQPQWKTV